jgi:hypothetical protein
LAATDPASGAPRTSPAAGESPAQPLHKSVGRGPLKRCSSCSQKPDGWQLWHLLRARRERPRHGSTIEQRDEVGRSLARRRVTSLMVIRGANSDMLAPTPLDTMLSRRNETRSPLRRRITTDRRGFVTNRGCSRCNRARPVRGVTDNEIRLGISAPFTQMKLGIETAFNLSG